MSDIHELSFEAAYAELDTIVEKLEAGDLSLEESLALFERGRQLSDHCQALLDKAELRVRKLNEDGSVDEM
ncbi:MAG: exodeoxyribonuclease VII small subunit [Chloroflexi bacterium]|nr:MAG: exodeoxyribonuclease VII small subunit [Chloroflexota bacterium]